VQVQLQMKLLLLNHCVFEGNAHFVLIFQATKAVYHSRVLQVIFDQSNERKAAKVLRTLIDRIYNGNRSDNSP